MNSCTYVYTCVCVCVSVCVLYTICFISTLYNSPMYLHPAVPPEVLIPLRNITLPQGNTHEFVCVAISNPRPVFIFRFNGERLMFDSSKHNLATNSTHATLTVSNITGSDEGSYTCSISNRFGSVSTAAVLTVEGGLGLKLALFYFYVYAFVSASTYVCVCVYCVIDFGCTV